MSLRRFRELLITIAILIGVVYLLWIVLSPLIPYVVVAVLLVVLYQFIFTRRRL